MPVLQIIPDEHTGLVAHSTSINKDYSTFPLAEMQTFERTQLQRFFGKKASATLKDHLRFIESGLECGLALPKTIEMYGAILNNRDPSMLYPILTFIIGNLGGILKTGGPLFEHAGVTEKNLAYIYIIIKELSHILGRYNSAQALAFHISGLIIEGSWDFAQHPSYRVVFGATIAAPAVLAVFSGSEIIYLSAINISRLSIKKLKQLWHAGPSLEDQESLLVLDSTKMPLSSQTKVPFYIYNTLNATLASYKLSALPIMLGGFASYKDEVEVAGSFYGHYGRLAFSGSAAILVGIVDYLLSRLEKNDISVAKYRTAIKEAIRITMFLSLLFEFAFDFKASIKDGDYFSFPIGTVVMLGTMLMMNYLNQRCKSSVVELSDLEVEEKEVASTRAEVIVEIDHDVAPKEQPSAVTQWFSDKHQQSITAFTKVKTLFTEKKQPNYVSPSELVATRYTH